MVALDETPTRDVSEQRSTDSLPSEVITATNSSGVTP